MTAAGAEARKSRIFISYRRDDADHAVGRLAEDLRRQFEHDQVFQDISSINPGADFEASLQEVLDSCAAVVVLIGPRWVNSKDVKERRRLDLEGDWVRREITESLRRSTVRVFPVLVGDTDMPEAEDLPESLRPVVRRQAFPLTVRHWANDVAELVGFLRQVPGLDQPPTEPPAAIRKVKPQAKSWRIALIVGMAIVAVVSGGYFVLDRIEKTAIAKAQAQADAERIARSKAEAEAVAAEERARQIKADADRRRQEKEAAAAAAKKAAAEKAEAKAAAEKEIADKAAAMAQATNPSVSITTARCTNLGAGQFRVDLAGEATGPVGALLYGASNPRRVAQPGTTSCSKWRSVKRRTPYATQIVCKRQNADPPSTRWKSSSVFSPDGKRPESSMAEIFEEDADGSNHRRLAVKMDRLICDSSITE